MSPRAAILLYNEIKAQIGMSPGEKLASGEQELRAELAR
jgi:hypothetical protein